MAKKADKKNRYGDRLITGEARLSFSHLDTPDSGGQYSDDKYKADLLFGDPKDPNMQSLIAGCKKLAKEYFGTDSTKDIKYPWKPSDKYAAKGYGGYEAGNYHITAKSTQKPRLKDVNKVDIEGSVFYGGCVVRANLTPGVYEKTENQTIVENGERREEEVMIKGITIYLNAMQFVKDGERFGGGGGDDFDDQYAGSQDAAESDDGF